MGKERFVGGLERLAKGKIRRRELEKYGKKNMDKKKTLILALIVTLFWGSLYPLVKLGYQAYNITTNGDILLFAGVRFTICGVIISLLALMKDKKSFTPVKSSILPILAFGLFAIVLQYAFTYIGMRDTDSSKTAILKQIGTLFYVCFSFLFFKDDKPTAKKLVGAALGFGGIIAINVAGSGFTFGIGDLLIITSSFCTVFANVISKKTFQKVDPIAATGCSQVFGGVVLWIVGWAMGGSFSLALDWNLWIFIYMCIASILGYCIWYSVVKNGALSNLFIIKFAEPMFSCILGALILQENIFQIQYLIAFLLIGGGIFLANTTKSNDKKIN